MQKGGSKASKARQSAQTIVYILASALTKISFLLAYYDTDHKRRRRVSNAKGRLKSKQGKAVRADNSLHIGKRSNEELRRFSAELYLILEPRSFKKTKKPRASYKDAFGVVPL